MKLIAFDLATYTGVAIGLVDGDPLCHTERLGETKASHAARFEQAFRMTRRLIDQHTPDTIVIELPIASGVKGAAQRVQLAMGFRACVAAMANMKRIRFAEYPVQSIRRHFIGQGNLKRDAAKGATIRRCQMIGWHVANDNEADAAALWSYARSKLAPKYQLKDVGGLFDACRDRAE